MTRPVWLSFACLVPAIVAGLGSAYFRHRKLQNLAPDASLVSALSGPGGNVRAELFTATGNHYRRRENRWAALAVLLAVIGGLLALALTSLAPAA